MGSDLFSALSWGLAFLLFEAGSGFLGGVGRQEGRGESGEEGRLYIEGRKLKREREEEEKQRA